MQHCKRLNTQGAILLEALLSIVILAVALTAVMQAVMSGLRASVAGADYLSAVNILDHVMAEQFISASAVNEPVRLTAPYERYAFVTHISKADEPVYKDLTLRHVQCAVEWPVGQGTRTLTAAFLTPGALQP